MGRFTQIVAKRFTWLLETAFEVESGRSQLSAQGWEQYNCVKKNLGIATSASSAGRVGGAAGNPVFNAIKGILDEP